MRWCKRMRVKLHNTEKISIIVHIYELAVMRGRRSEIRNNKILKIKIIFASKKEKNYLCSVIKGKIMETTVTYQPFNATQLHLLKMFSFTKTEQTLQDLKKLLRSFYIKQIENEVDKYKIDDQMLNEHLRTPYK